MICYAVIDTNVLVSALLSRHANSATVQVVGKIFKGEIIPVFSSYILSEYKEVLCRKKFSFSQELITSLLEAIMNCGIMISPAPTGEILPDMSDLPFYEVVCELKDNGAYLVTGNLKHFPDKPFIVTANQLLGLLNKS